MSGMTYQECVGRLQSGEFTLTSEDIPKAQQMAICLALGTNPHLEYDDELQQELDRRIGFIKERIKAAGASSLVLGISGGVDSLVAGRLCQIAVTQLRNEGYQAEFIGVHLPYKEQLDFESAQAAIDVIKPDQVRTINIAESVDGMMAQFNLADMPAAKADFVKGNVKARARMIAQYSIANLHNGLVVGTDHAAEAVMGFFTKFGDGACDLAPLSGLVKKQVRQAALLLGASEDQAFKTPTADLEDLDPGKPDEAAYGCSYDQIDAFLLGQDVPNEVARKIVAQYQKTMHKREMPYTP